MSEPFRDLGRRVSNWERWGADDVLGTLNLISADARTAAAALVRTGVSIPLGLSFGSEGPQIATGRRQNPIHVITRFFETSDTEGTVAVLDDAIFMHTRCATHIDGLGQVAYDGLHYNGRPALDSAHGAPEALGVDAMRNGIQGRGVLLDVAGWMSRDRLDAGEGITAADLERVAEFQNVRLRPGDIVLVRTGWMRVFTHDRDRLRFLGAEPGLSLDTAELLRDLDVAFLAADNWGIDSVVEAGGHELSPLRAILIRDLGMPLGKLFDLEALAVHCRTLASWVFQFACLPLPITSGIGSPVAPVATF